MKIAILIVLFNVFLFWTLSAALKAAEFELTRNNEQLKVIAGAMAK